MINNKPRILMFDIETAPNLSYVWGKWEQDVIDFKKEWYMLSFSAKWLDDKKIISFKLPDFDLYKKDKENDFELVKKLWECLDKADIVIAHNGDEFDIKKSNARFIFHGLNPPSSYRTIDTKKIAKKYFSFNSNSLNDLGKFLKIGEKFKHQGFDLWLKCMNGDRSAWKIMEKYNQQDVILLEKIYKKFLAWIQNHPNYGIYQNKEYVCPNCGSTKIHKRGFGYTKTNAYQKWQCQDCFAWSQSVKSENVIKPQIKN